MQGGMQVWRKNKPYEKKTASSTHAKIIGKKITRGREEIMQIRSNPSRKAIQ
jgi:hypothetical protein